MPQTESHLHPDDIVFRVRRLYEALRSNVEFDVYKFPPQIHTTERGQLVHQDFSGGASPEQIANQAFTVIHAIANLRDHLRRWAKLGSKKDRVDETIKGSFAIQVMKDVSNWEKHGPARKTETLTQLAPTLRNIIRAARLETGAAPNSAVCMTLGGKGPVVNASGGGRFLVVVTAEVVDLSGNVLGDLYEIQVKAVDAWEELMVEFGLINRAQVNAQA